MKDVLPCAIYTRKSSEEGLEQGFNSLDAQREACEAYILSQREQGWKPLPARYDDGGFSGGNVERPAMQRLLADIAVKRVRVIVVYKVDRLTRSLADFAKLVELFDAHGVSFVSVTQQFNTTSSMGRLTLNVLLSFAQFEREVTGERIRDKIAASKKKGMWMGGFVPTGYLPHERTLVIDEAQAQRIREIYRLYLASGCVRKLKLEIDRRGWVTPTRTTRRDNMTGGRPFSRGHLYRILSNPIYIGQIAHKKEIFDGQHPAIVDQELWLTVQEKLKTNRHEHQSRSHIAEPGLLAGLAYDDLGRRLAPTHSKKGAKRYRYYVGQPDRPDAKALRWPAQELEGAVVNALEEFLMDRSRLVGLMGKLPANDTEDRLKMAAGLAKQIATASMSVRIEILQRIVSRVTIHRDRLDVVVRPEAIWSTTYKPMVDETTELIEVPVELKRCGLGVRLIVRNHGEVVSRGPDPALTALIAKAHDWFERLSSGRSENVQAIATEEKVDRSYARRVIYLAFLDPEIVKRIMCGYQPPDLNATRLLRMTPLPMSWAEQRAKLGMAN